MFFLDIWFRNAAYIDFFAHQDYSIPIYSNGSFRTSGLPKEFRKKIQEKFNLVNRQNITRGKTSTIGTAGDDIGVRRKGTVSPDDGVKDNLGKDSDADYLETSSDDYDTLKAGRMVANKYSDKESTDDELYVDAIEFADDEDRRMLDGDDSKVAGELNVDAIKSTDAEDRRMLGDAKEDRTELDDDADSRVAEELYVDAIKSADDEDRRMLGDAKSVDNENRTALSDDAEEARTKLDDAKEDRTILDADTEVDDGVRLHINVNISDNGDSETARQSENKMSNIMINNAHVTTSVDTFWTRPFLSFPSYPNSLDKYFSSQIWQKSFNDSSTSSPKFLMILWNGLIDLFIPQNDLLYLTRNRLPKDTPSHTFWSALQTVSYKFFVPEKSTATVTDTGNSFMQDSWFYERTFDYEAKETYMTFIITLCVLSLCGMSCLLCVFCLYKRRITKVGEMFSV